MTETHLPDADPLIEVARSGGFAGLTVKSTFRLGELQPEEATLWRRLIGDPQGPGVLANLAGEAASNRAVSRGADRFVYRVRCAATGLDVTVPEQSTPQWVRSALDGGLQLG